MAAFIWMWFILLARFIYSYVNLCKTKENVVATQSSTYEAQVASLAIDGIRSQNYASCIHTEIYQLPPAWVQVDLGRTYSLSYIVIYYRNEENWKPYRFRKYYLETKTTTLQIKHCYTDNTPDSEIPNATQTISCKSDARYVIVGTNYDAPEDYIPGPVLEICEIEVYGCDVGHYGENCLSCPGCSKCDINSGVCDNQCSNTCTGGQCDDSGLCVQGCMSGYWGNNCTDRCPASCFDNNCHNNGTCIGCRSGSYGDYCTEKCNNRCNSNVCNQNTGDCADNCVVGYYGSKCESSCSTTCSPESCIKDDGACLNGCKNGFFGSQCEHQCNQQCTNTSCDVFSGHCVGGFNEGFYGAFCNLTCSSKCATSKCNQSDGVCNDGCLPQWSGKTCEANQQLSENNTKTEVYLALYVVVAILLISIFLNVFLIVRNARKNINKRQKTEHLKEICHVDQNKDANKAVYDSVEDNAGYHELGELSQPSHYAQLK